MNDEAIFAPIHVCLAMIPGVLVMGLGWVLNVNPEGLVMRLNGEMRGCPATLSMREIIPRQGPAHQPRANGPLTVTDSPEPSPTTAGHREALALSQDTSGWLDQNSVPSSRPVLFHPCSYLVL